jgi:hypothetical protein
LVSVLFPTLSDASVPVPDSSNCQYDTGVVIDVEAVTPLPPVVILPRSL